MDERDLIVRIQRGEKEEFRRFVREYQERIFRLIFRQVGDSAAAKDLTQETFIRAYNGLKKFRFEASFSTWITRIALNATANYFSSRSFVERSKSRPLEDATGLAAADSSENADDERLLDELRGAIAELKPIYREVIVLCALERKSYEEASAMLDLPIGTVRSRLNSARNILRKKLFVDDKA